MVGERDRETVLWELGDSSPPPFANVINNQQLQQLQQQQLQLQSSNLQTSCQSNNNNASSGIDSGMGVVGDGIYFDDGTNLQTTGSIGGVGGGLRDGASGGGGGAAGSGKEVRYAPFPIASPAHSNPTTTCHQIPLQRAHSRSL